ncbi:tax1-binding protein 1 homolog isoform X2 [Nilaparvata lugens]|uniref:tax1-binding protein 1 homolog isoform X2 n=1 Tax=Nilaparvata lugens TaxID=108931 RepID=UPI00193EA3DA|nr:tax1-binding protein 1 homolog isoform X2 [Nilaparvata lugens]
MFPSEKVFVQFVDVQEQYFLDKMYLPINYVLDKEYKPTSKDFIGIFPRGWREFDQMILGDYIHPRSIGSKDTKISYQLPFSFSENRMTCFNADYQLVYVNSDRQVLGRSPYFKIYRTSEDRNVVYEGQGSANVNHAAISKSIESELTKMVSKMSVEVRNHREKWEEKAKEQPVFRPAINYGGKTPSPFKNRRPLGDSSPQTSPAGFSPNFRKNYTAPRCEFCQRTGELTNENRKLIEQVKNLAECNYDLRKKLHDIQNELELSYASQKYQRLQLCRLLFQVESYENVTKNLVKNLQGYSTVCIDDSGKEIMVQRVNPDMERKLMVYTGRPSHQNERFLKAIIGNQEQRIQELTNRLLELELPFNASESCNDSNVCEGRVREEDTEDN